MRVGEQKNELIYGQPLKTNSQFVRNGRGAKYISICHTFKDSKSVYLRSFELKEQN
jgi:hypothetical protein